MTASEFKEKYTALNKFDVREVGRALKKIGIEQKKDRKGNRFYMLPPPKTNWNTDLP
jgi:hypothetical protein